MASQQPSGAAARLLKQHAQVAQLRAHRIRARGLLRSILRLHGAVFPVNSTSVTNDNNRIENSANNGRMGASGETSVERELGDAHVKSEFRLHAYAPGARPEAAESDVFLRAWEQYLKVLGAQHATQQALRLREHEEARHNGGNSADEAGVRLGKELSAVERARLSGDQTRKLRELKEAISEGFD
jgi:Complex1_LYR-like